LVGKLVFLDSDSAVCAMDNLHNTHSRAGENVFLLSKGSRSAISQEESEDCRVRAYGTSVCVWRVL